MKNRHINFANKILILFCKNHFLNPVIFSILFHGVLLGSSIQDKDDINLYQKGIQLRYEKRYAEAISCFQQLAGKGDVKVQYNIGYCLYYLNRNQEAYDWLKRASNQKFELAEKNIQKIDLIVSSLPIDLFPLIASHLNMKDLSYFGSVSKRAPLIFKSIVTTTNFLTSQNPYARDFYSLFNKVTFDPQPQAIRWVSSVEASTLEVHFRNPEHLRNIVERTPYFKGKDNLFFIQNENVEDCKELISPEGDLVHQYFIRIISDKPITIKGELKLPSLLVLPFPCNIQEFNGKTKSISSDQSKPSQKAQDLATALESFNEQLFAIRTADAYALLQDRQEDRVKYPKLFPDLSALCPHAYFLSDSEIKIVQKDYISATKPIIYRAKSISDLYEMLLDLPDFYFTSHKSLQLYSSIYYIDSTCHQSGIYCSGPLSLKKGFEIFCDQDLTVTGILNLDEYQIKMISNRSIWTFGLSLTAFDMSIIAPQKFLLGNINRFLRENIKPEGMPEKDWNRFLTFGLERGLFS